METAGLKRMKAEVALIRSIAKRAQALAEEYDVIRSLLDWEMDVELAHSVNPLRLSDLLKADDGNFGHDVFGIYNHLDRTTGELTDCFSPRFSA